MNKSFLLFGMVFGAGAVADVSTHRCALTVDQRIDQYVALIGRLANHSAVPITNVKVLAFTTPSIIVCYNQLVQSGHADPVAALWQSYRARTAPDVTFKYELCHLILIVLQHYAYHLLADAMGKQEQNAVDQLSATLPIDDLLNMIDLFYQRLLEFLDKADQQKPGTQWHLPIPRRWLALAVVSVIFASKVYQKWFARQPQASPTTPVVSGSASH